jgi:hypothetical protein
MPKRQISNIYQLIMSYGLTTNTPMIRLGSTKGHSSDSKSTENSNQEMPGFHYLVDLRHPQSSHFAYRDAMQSSFVHLFYLTSKGISATASAGKRFEVSASISILHQLTTPNGRGTKLPDSNPSGSCIRLILLMLHSVTSSCLTT